MLFSFSNITISDYELSRLNFASNARKQMLALMDGMVDNLAEARAARWVLELHQEDSNLPQEGGVGRWTRTE
jgi:hypothetical protein